MYNVYNKCTYTLMLPLSCETSVIDDAARKKWHKTDACKTARAILDNNEANCFIVHHQWCDTQDYNDDF